MNKVRPRLIIDRPHQRSNLQVVRKRCGCHAVVLLNVLLPCCQLLNELVTGTVQLRTQARVQKCQLTVSRLRLVLLRQLPPCLQPVARGHCLQLSQSWPGQQADHEVVELGLQRQLVFVRRQSDGYGARSCRSHAWPVPLVQQGTVGTKGETPIFPMALLSVE